MGLDVDSELENFGHGVTLFFDVGLVIFFYIHWKSCVIAPEATRTAPSPKVTEDDSVPTTSFDMKLLTLCVFCVAFGTTVEADKSRNFSSNSRLILGTENNLSASLRIGDLDGDHDLDIVVANGRHWPQQNYIFYNQGRARFKLMRPLGFDLATSYATELADLDGDGDIDIAVGNDTAPNAIFLNEGDGRFRHSGTFGKPSSIRSLTLADIDSDGDVDILANARGNPNMIFYNDGKARFAESRMFGNRSDSTIDVAVGDLDQDGQPDLVLANRDAQQNVVILNDGRGGFERRIPFGSGSDETRAVADLDRDGKLDWIVGNIGQPNTVYLGNGNGGFRESADFGRTDGQTYSIAVGDMNNDQLPDIIVGNTGQRNAVYLNLGDGASFREQLFGGVSEVSYNLAVGDLDDDGFLDIAVANSNGQNPIYLNRPAK